MPSGALFASRSLNSWPMPIEGCPLALVEAGTEKRS